MKLRYNNKLINLFFNFNIIFCKIDVYCIVLYFINNEDIFNVFSMGFEENI